MGARELLRELTGAGFSVEVEGDKLMIRPASRLTDALRAELRAAKPGLMTLLQGESSAAAIRAHAREAMHRLGYCDGEAEAQLQETLETVPAAIVAADLQAIGAERGLPPVPDPAQEVYTERLKRRGLPLAVIATIAPKLAQRDRECVDLRSCSECARFERGRPWFCGHPSQRVKSGCHGASVLFRCEGFLGVSMKPNAWRVARFGDGTFGVYRSERGEVTYSGAPRRHSFATQQAAEDWRDRLNGD